MASSSALLDALSASQGQEALHEVLEPLGFGARRLEALAGSGGIALEEVVGLFEPQPQRGQRRPQLMRRVPANARWRASTPWSRVAMALNARARARTSAGPSSAGALASKPPLASASVAVRSRRNGRVTVPASSERGDRCRNERDGGHDEKPADSSCHPVVNDLFGIREPDRAVDRLPGQHRDGDVHERLAEGLRLAPAR